MNDFDKFKQVIMEDIKVKFLNVMVKYMSGIENTEQIQRVLKYQYELLDESFKTEGFDIYVQQYKDKVENFNNICEYYFADKNNENTKQLKLTEKIINRLKEDYDYEINRGFSDEKIEPELLDTKRKIVIYKKRQNWNHMCFFSSNIKDISPFIEKQLGPYKINFEVNRLAENLEAHHEQVKEINKLVDTIFLDSEYITKLMTVMTRLPFAFKDAFFENFQEAFVIPSGGYEVVMGRKILEMSAKDVMGFINIETTHSKNVFLFLQSISPTINVDHRNKEKFETLVPKLLNLLGDKLNSETLVSFYLKAITMCKEQVGDKALIVDKKKMFEKMAERKEVTGENLKFGKIILSGESESFIRKMKDSYVDLIDEFTIFELNQRREKMFDKIKKGEDYNPFGVKKARVILFDMEKLLDYSLFNMRDMDNDVSFTGNGFNLIPTNYFSDKNSVKTMKHLSISMEDNELLSDNEVLMGVIQSFDNLKGKKINKNIGGKDDFSNLFERFIREQILLKKFEKEKDSVVTKRNKI